MKFTDLSTFHMLTLRNVIRIKLIKIQKLTYSSFNTISFSDGGAIVSVISSSFVLFLPPLNGFLSSFFGGIILTIKYNNCCSIRVEADN